MIEFVEFQLYNFDLKFTPKPNGREGVDCLIGNTQIYR
jgi:hypothetical protein